MTPDNKRPRPFYILLIAIVILIVISFFPLSKFTGGLLRNYNLLNEIITLNFPKQSPDSSQNIDAALGVDPALIEEIKNNEGINDTIAVDLDTTKVEINLAKLPDSMIKISAPSRIGDTVIIEDYSIDQTGFSNFKYALSRKAVLGRPVRVAFVGDSYIEGDIFSQHVRELLQDLYGGGGVGYMNMHSEFPGFRRSINQRSSGWEAHDVVKNNLSSSYYFLSQQYFKSTQSSSSTYNGRDYTRHTKTWNSSKFIFVSPVNSTIQVKSHDNWVAYNITGNDSVQCISLEDTLSTLSIKTATPGVIALGVWLECSNGITVDCMSTRGNSGITLKRINKAFTSQIRKFIDYDLIILEFGINAMSPGQTNFSAYAHHMSETISHIRSCYPQADILIMGIGDRGEKQGGAVRSMSNVQQMIDAQRRMARETGCMFWDTREAMGGADASARWASHAPAYMNKDYIHLSYKGGEVLAGEFVKSLIHSLNE